MCSAIASTAFGVCLPAEGDEEIEIADGFLAAAQRAGRRDGLDWLAELADVSGELGGASLRRHRCGSGRRIS